MSTPDLSEGYRALMEERRSALTADLRRILQVPCSFVCEIGCGHGHYLTAFANIHRNLPCIGIDIIGDRVLRANRKRDRAKLAHLHFVHAEARLFLEQLPAGATIRQVLILFPDPWPKTRHHKNRILQKSFLSLLRTKSAPDAELFFRTDYLPYFREATEAVQQHPAWTLSNAPWPFEHDTVFQQRAASYHSLSARAAIS